MCVSKCNAVSMDEDDQLARDNCMDRCLVKFDETKKVVEKELEKRAGASSSLVCSNTHELMILLTRTSPSGPRCSQCTSAWPPPCSCLFLTQTQKPNPSEHSKRSTSPSPTESQAHTTCTVKLNTPGAGILQSPMVACLKRAYPASLSSLLTVFVGCQLRTYSAVSWNFF